VSAALFFRGCAILRVTMTGTYPAKETDMRTNATSIAFLAIAMIVIGVGCNKKDEKPAVPAPTAPPTPKSSAASGIGMPTNSPPPAVPAAANSAAADASNAAQAQAKQLIDQAMQYIKENKLDLAEKALNQLDSMKSQLPPEMAPRIEQVRSALKAAKAGSQMLPPTTSGSDNK
jgi:hypothetical protein